jgi:hypothetical protein
MRVKPSLLSPLRQPRSPERLAGVCTTVWAVPGDEIRVVDRDLYPSHYS